MRQWSKVDGKFVMQIPYNSLEARKINGMMVDAGAKTFQWLNKQRQKFNVVGLPCEHYYNAIPVRALMCTRLKKNRNNPLKKLNAMGLLTDNCHHSIIGTRIRGQ